MLLINKLIDVTSATAVNDYFTFKGELNPWISTWINKSSTLRDRVRMARERMLKAVDSFDLNRHNASCLADDIAYEASDLSQCIDAVKAHDAEMEILKAHLIKGCAGTPTAKSLELAIDTLNPELLK